MSYLKISKILCCSIIFTILLYFTAIAFAQDKAQVYSTWDTLEVDTCATAWLIKNFVDKTAVFRFYPKGEIITEGIAFDTPDAEFRRTAAFCAFETVINKYKISDPRIKEIGHLIHEIEINYWAHDSDLKIQELKQNVSAAVQAVEGPEKGLEQTFLIFDKLYDNLTI